MFTAEAISKSYGPNVVLDRIGFEVPSNSVVAIVGENGAGKSTLLNILSGLTPQHSGRMTLNGRPYAPDGYGAAVAAGVSRVFQEQALIQNIPVYENLLLGRDRKFARAAQFINKRAMVETAQRIMDDAGIDIDVRRRTGSFDFSKRQSIEIARACLATTHIDNVERPFVLLDEPTSALDRRDEEAFFRLVEKIKKRGSLLFVSHRLSEVLALSDVIYVLKDGAVVARLDPKTTNESALHGLMVGRERSADYYFERRQRAITEEEVVLDLVGLTNPGVFTDVSLSVRAGEVVGIGGLLDSGKSAFGKSAAGVDPPGVGTISLSGRRPQKPHIGRLVGQGLAYVPAERLTEGLIASFSVAWNVSLASGRDLFSGRLGFWRRRRETDAAARYVSSLGIRSAGPNVVCTRLSGGNQQKVVLARWLARDPKVLILDNPTRGVDAGAKGEIYGLIRDLSDRGVAILLITDELLELIGLSNRVLIMQRGRVVTELTTPAHAKPTERDLVAWMLPQGRGSTGSTPRERVRSIVDAGEPGMELSQ
jgi:ribose transport system ATP-binding protein